MTLFQQQYPAASLVAELVTLHQDNFVVRALVQMAGVTLASGMAAHIDIEAAEDRAKLRSLEALGLNTSSNGALTPVINPAMHPAINPVAQSAMHPVTNPAMHPAMNPAMNPTINPAMGDRYPLPTSTELPPLSGSLLDSYRHAVATDTSLQSSPSAAGSPLDSRLPDPGDFSTHFDSESEPSVIPELSEMIESPDFDAEFDRPSFGDSEEFDRSSFGDSEFSHSEFGHSEFTPANVIPGANLLDEVTQPQAELLVTSSTKKLAAEKPKSSRKKSTTSSESSGTEVAVAAEASPTAIAPPARERSEDIARIGMEMKRLGWTTDQGREHIKTIYGKRSRQELSDDELADFLNYLESQAVGAGK